MAMPAPFGRLTAPRFDALRPVGDDNGRGTLKDRRGAWEKVQAWGPGNLLAHDEGPREEPSRQQFRPAPPPPFDTFRPPTPPQLAPDRNEGRWQARAHAPPPGEDTTGRRALQPTPEAMARLHDGRHAARAEWAERGRRLEGRFDKRQGAGANGVRDGLHDGRWQARADPPPSAVRFAKPPREPPPPPPGAAVPPPTPGWVANMHAGRWQARAAAAPEDALAKDRRAGAFEAQGALTREARAPWIAKQTGPARSAEPRLDSTPSDARAEDVVSRVARQRELAAARLRRRLGADAPASFGPVDPRRPTATVDAELAEAHRRARTVAFA